MIGPYPDLMSAAESYVFETKGYKFSNNNDEAANNFNSFMAGAEFVLNVLSCQTPALWTIQWKDNSCVDPEFCFLSKIEAENYLLERNISNAQIVPLVISDRVFRQTKLGDL